MFLSCTIEESKVAKIWNALLVVKLLTNVNLLWHTGYHKGHLGHSQTTERKKEGTYSDKRKKEELEIKQIESKPESYLGYFYEQN